MTAAAAHARDAHARGRKVAPARQELARSKSGQRRFVKEGGSLDKAAVYVRSLSGRRLVRQASGRLQKKLSLIGQKPRRSEYAAASRYARRGGGLGTE